MSAEDADGSFDPVEVTRLLQATSDGDERASDRLFEALYGELRGRARRLIARSPDDTLQPTALVHEAWLRLAKANPDDTPLDRTGFLSVAARVMRTALVDQVRRSAALKRGGDQRRQSLTLALDGQSLQGVDVLELNDALELLAGTDPRQARIVELRFFAGLELEEAASVIGISRATAYRDWHLARMWLRMKLDSHDA